jgi:transposase InsO family protein
MSGKGNCYDNASVETFFKTIRLQDHQASRPSSFKTIKLQDHQGETDLAATPNNTCFLV